MTIHSTTDADMHLNRSSGPFMVRWERITFDNPGLGRRLQDVMRDMDHHYREGEWDEIFETMTGTICEYYLGTGDGFEIAIGYQWDEQRDKYQVRSVGFRGSLEPHTALDEVARHVQAFAHERKQSAALRHHSLVHG